MAARLRARHPLWTLLACWLLLVAHQARAGEWTTSWATAPMAMEGDNALPAGEGAVTVDQTLRLSIGGDRLRLRVTNRHGDRPLPIAAVTVAQAPAAGVAQSRPDTERRVTFGGSAAVTIPAGAEYWSDPIALAAAPRSHLRVTMTLPPAGVRTGHPGARTTTHVRYGDAPAVEVPRWYHLAAVDVDTGGGATIAVIGDSITDGYGVVENADARWTDMLAERLAASPATDHLGVANLGIGGNRLLLDGLGPNALARLDRDVLALSGLSDVVVLIGVNDLGTLTRDAPVSDAAHDELVARMIGGYRQVAARVRAAGARVIGATIMPYGSSDYYHSDARNEADRQALNAFIRAPGSFDAVIDFDAATRDPAAPHRLRAGVDSGDGLHPSDAGYRVMAAAVPLALFAKPRAAAAERR